jgi:serine/threonine protein phosphatase 1
MIETSEGRTFAVGDIHGCFTALEVLLSGLALTGKDRLILLGDVIDRGPNTRSVVELLLDVSQSCQLDLIMGNHEEMLFDALHDPRTGRLWYGWGGAETLNSYGGFLEDIPEVHLDFLASGQPYVQTETDILIHANLEPGVPLEEQTTEWLRWEKLTGHEEPHPSGRRVICGHTEMPGGVPGVAPGWVMLDTSAYRGGFLTALDLHSGELLQAAQTGEFRRGVSLSEL